MNFICLLFIFIYNISSILSQVYNFVDQQNYELDLLFTHLPGIDLYYYNKDNSSLFIVDIYPDSTLKIKMKLYTNNTELINTINNGNSLYFGFDFNTTVIDIALQGYRADIILCVLNKNEARCDDYDYDTQLQEYTKNTNARYLKSK